MNLVQHSIRLYLSHNEYLLDIKLQAGFLLFFSSLDSYRGLGIASSTKNSYHGANSD